MENANTGGSKIFGAEFENGLVEMRSKQSHFSDAPVLLAVAV